MNIPKTHIETFNEMLESVFNCRMEKSPFKKELFRGMYGDNLVVLRPAVNEDFFEVFISDSRKKTEVMNTFFSMFNQKEGENESDM